MQIRRWVEALCVFLGVMASPVAVADISPTSTPVPEHRLPETEVVSEFDIEGVHFLLLWKPGLCLLRTVESYGTPDAVQYTVADLFVQLYDGTPDYEQSKEKAIAQAPLVARELVHQQREQEALMMERLYTSSDMQREHPVYQIWQQKVGGKLYPVIWASHNAGLYMRINGQWRVAGFALSRKEAETKI